MMSVHTWVFSFQWDGWKYLIKPKLTLGFFARSVWCMATAAFPWWSVSGVGCLPSFHDLKKNYKNLEVLMGIKDNFQKQYFGKISFTMFFLLLECHKNKEELSAVCN